MQEFGQNPLSRRSVLKAGIAGAASLSMPVPSFAQDRKVVVALWAGASADAMKTIYGEAFAGTGITLDYDESGPEAAKVRSMVEAGQVSWDVADLSVADSTLLGKAGLARAIDYNIVPKDSVIPGFAYEFAVASYLFSSIISFDRKALGGKAPAGWADFWDVEKFPGKRAMYKHIEGTLEAALLADGVPLDQIYPIDEERAFAKLKEILPHAIFWNSGSESQQLMRDGETVMGNLWSTRATQLALEDKERFGLEFNGGLLLPASWGVMAKNPGGDAVFEAIAKMLDAEVQAKVFAATNLSPSNPAAEKFIPAEMVPFNPTSAENVAKQVPVDVQWYIDNQERVQTSFLELIAS
ncbi:MAG: bacterial extracellular solute-binding protein [Rhizobiaceae bacterium]|nr:bacterial extracellular solute-binding protein [Rhizobiaceae bacterium]